MQFYRTRNVSPRASSYDWERHASDHGLKIELRGYVIRLYFKKRTVGHAGYLEIAHPLAFKKFGLQVIVIGNI